MAPRSVAVSASWAFLRLKLNCLLTILSISPCSALRNCLEIVHFLLHIKNHDLMVHLDVILLSAFTNSPQFRFFPQMEVRLPFIIPIEWDFVFGRGGCSQNGGCFKSMFKANFQNGWKRAPYRTLARRDGCLQEGSGLDAWVWQSPSVLPAGAAIPHRDVQGKDTIKYFKIKQQWAQWIWLNSNFPPLCIPPAFPSRGLKAGGQAWNMLFKNFNVLQRGSFWKVVYKMAFLICANKIHRNPEFSQGRGRKYILWQPRRVLGVHLRMVYTRVHMCV